jgi:hypothetical protein
MTRNKTQKFDSSDHAVDVKGIGSHAGRSGGRLPREIDTLDELKPATEHPSGKTSVNKSDEKDAQSK